MCQRFFYALYNYEQQRFIWLILNQQLHVKQNDETNEIWSAYLSVANEAAVLHTITHHT